MGTTPSIGVSRPNFICVSSIIVHLQICLSRCIQICTSTVKSSYFCHKCLLLLHAAGGKQSDLDACEGQQV